MNTYSSPPARAPREQVQVTCSKCGVATTVPFTPTPGRPVYCRDCFQKTGGAPTGGPRSAPSGPRSSGPPSRYASRDEPTNRPSPRKFMLSQGRKAHFVYDAKEVLAREGGMAEDQRRAFIETLFTRGARQSSDAATAFLDEKAAEGVITDEEGKRLYRLLERYSLRR